MKEMRLIPGKTAAIFYNQDVISNPKGEVRKYLPKPGEESSFVKEVYFSRLLSNEQKKWKCNKNQVQNITVAFGRIAVICISSINGGFVYEEFLIDAGLNHGVLEIPSGTIYGLFTDSEGALIVNALKDFYRVSDAMEVLDKFDLTPKSL
jgi:hypothetical protein